MTMPIPATRVGIRSNKLCGIVADCLKGKGRTALSLILPPV